MKALFFSGLLWTLTMLTSCSSGKQTTGSSQPSKQNFLQLKGSWQITSIDYDKDYKIKPFDEGMDAQCFVGSIWKLIPNNYTGSYSTTPSKDCSSRTQPIKFDITGGNNFMFKKITEGTKAKQNTTGYSLYYNNISATSFSLQQDIPFEGTTIKAIYHFQKIAEK